MLNRFFSRFRRTRPITRSVPKPRTRALSLEALESREVPAVAYALSDANTLLRFDTATPGTLAATTAVTGLATGDALVGIDFRPRTGQLIGVAVNGTTVSTYSIAPLTGAATLIGTPATVTGITGATKFGVDFNPTVDRIRVTTDLTSDGAGGNTNNFRLNPNNGALVAIDTDLDYTALPNGIADGPEVGVAYSNNFDNPGTTVLRGIVSDGDLLVTNGGAGPSFAVLASIGALGADTGDNAEFDIVVTSTGTQSAFAVLTVGGVSQLYTINVTTGAATLVGTVGAGTTPVVGFTVAPTGTLVVGSGLGATGDVRILDPITGAIRGNSITPFSNFAGGVRVATGDINRDGVPDVIVGAEAPNGHVKVFDGVTGAEVRSFFAFLGFNGTVNVASGDVNGDGFDDIIVSANGVAGGHVKVFDGTSTTNNADGTPVNAAVLASFFAYPAGTDSSVGTGGFLGNVAVAAADFNNDGTAELVTVANNNAHVKVFTVAGGTATPFTSGAGGAGFSSFLAFGPVNGVGGSGATTFTVAAGDVNRDGTPDIVFGSGVGTRGHIRVISGRSATTELASFFAFESTFTGGASVGLADANSDGLLDIRVTPGIGKPAQVVTFNLDGSMLGTPVDTFANFQGGSTVAGARF